MSMKRKNYQPVQAETALMLGFTNIGDVSGTPTAARTTVEAGAPVFVLRPEPRVPELPLRNREIQATSAVTTAVANDLKPEVVPVVLSREYLPDRYFDVRQFWQGTVDSVARDGVKAVLEDVTNPQNSRETAIIQWEDIPEGDADLVAPGAVFYWSIGYESTITGQRNGVSSIRFRRLPAWTRSELEAAHREAQELEQLFGDPTSVATTGRR